MATRASEAQAPSLANRRPASLAPHLRQRRERIVTAALDLLNESEYDKVQMRDVAERAGVALGTVYRYFTSKEHLYAAVLLAWSADFFARIDPTSGGGARDDPDATDEQRLRRMLRRTIRSVQRVPQVTRVEMVLETSTDENARALHDEFSTLYRSAMDASVRDMDPTIAANVLTVVHSVVYRSMRQWALGYRSLRDVERDFDATIDVIFSPSPS